jgi:GntR family transcriptional regulator
MSSRSDPELALQGGTSICNQIRTQIRDCVVSGQLLPGEQLPTVRAMAVELSVNPSAVSKAYQELEQEGVLTSEEGSGTFVASGAPSRQRPHDGQAEFDKLCQEFLAQAARCGYSTADVLVAIQALTVPKADGPVEGRGTVPCLNPRKMSP